MKVIYIGGAAHGDEMERVGTAHTAMVSFKFQDDLPSDQLRVHSYDLKSFTARRPSGEHLEVEFFVLQGLPEDAVKSLVRARTLLEIQY
jgi:hypothetical protein